MLGTLLFSLLAGGVYLVFLLYIDWTRVHPRMAGDQRTGAARGFPGHGRRPRQHAGGGPPRAVPTNTAAPPSNWPRPTCRCARRKRRCGARIAWPPSGQLSAGLAHELRNPLGTIKASAEMLGRNLPRGERSGARNGRLHHQRSGPRQLADHPLPAIRPPAPDARRKRPTWRRCWTGAIAMAGARGARESPSTSNYSPEIPPFPLRRRTDGARLLQPGAECGAGHARRAARSR